LDQLRQICCRDGQQADGASDAEITHVGLAPGRRRRKPHQHCRSFGVGGFLSQAVRRYWAKRQQPQFLRTRLMLMMATVAIPMAAHVTEVLVWAATCAMVGATPAGASHVYLAFVS
jgi:hypothetical protein